MSKLLCDCYCSFEYKSHCGLWEFKTPQRFKFYNTVRLRHISLDAGLFWVAATFTTQFPTFCNMPCNRFQFHSLFSCFLFQSGFLFSVPGLYHSPDVLFHFKGSAVNLLIRFGKFLTFYKVHIHVIPFCFCLFEYKVILVK